MKTETYTLSMEQGPNNEYTARLGVCTGTGTTRETALTALAQRISGLPNVDRKTLWGGGGEQTQTAG